MKLKLKQLTFLTFLMCAFVFFSTAIAGVLQPTVAYASKVYIDAGHGGGDSGAIGSGYREENLTAELAKLVGKQLQSRYPTIDYYVNTSGIDFTVRGNDAKNKGCDAFVSIHFNSSSNSSATGTESYVYSDSSKRHKNSIALQNSLHDRLVKATTLSNRGKKQNLFAVTRAPMASVLCEIAFISNYNDMRIYQVHKNAIAIALADGIAAFYGVTEKFSEKTYSSIYNYSYYLSNNPDVKKAYNSNRSQTFQHFLNYGMKEGRKSISTFDVGSYAKKYQDLRASFGADVKSYYIHYALYGKNEKRVATGVTTMQNIRVKWGKTNYSKVYNPTFYLNKYSDLKKAFTVKAGNTTFISDTELLKHALNYGMYEGRMTISGFDVSSYANKYQDLRASFGSNVKAYYLHYANYGRNEKRVTSGVTSLQNWRVKKGGINYTAVYNPSYYLNKYSDLKKTFTINTSHGQFIDDTGLLNHFIQYGMKEGRQAKKDFNVYYYKAQYSDLRAAFGNNLKGYYIHYVQHGQAEGRKISGTYIKEAIMGNSQTTVAQMVRRFNAVGKKYPSGVYSKYGAANIKTFCTILLSEAKAEGVRAEVVFAQAMHETGWLQFGGDVKANQCNFAGIGATGGVPGNSFNTYGSNSVRMGLRAQVQHLKAYASTSALKNACVDPRFGYVKRGCAPSVYDLGGKWATGADYGYAVANQIDALLKS